MNSLNFRIRRAPRRKGSHMTTAWHIYPNSTAAKDWSRSLVGHIGSIKIWNIEELKEYEKAVERFKNKSRTAQVT